MANLQLKTDSGTLCLLCPNKCILNADREYGICGIRKYDKKNGDIVNPYSGIISAEAIDPIEKKPLFHFMPGTQVYSIGFYGCTLKCKFCQNHTISQHIPPAESLRVTPEKFVDILIRNKFKSVAFTYSEPLLYFEWVLETAKIAKKNGIKTVLVTNGYINTDPAAELLDYIDAANIDLKSYSDDFYKNMVSGRVEPVKEFIKLAYIKGVNIEVTTLIIPGYNDSFEEIDKLSDFLLHISPDIPYHVTGYHPAYKLTVPPTKAEKLLKIAEIAKGKINFVYTGNVGIGNNSICKQCGSTLVERGVYSVNITGLDGNGCCVKCGCNNNFVL